MEFCRNETIIINNMLLAKLLLLVLPFACPSGKTGSHEGLEAYSSLTPVSGYNIVVPNEFLGFKGKAIYPRIKKMANGEYIMFVQSGRIASNTYCLISKDLKNWEKPQPLFKSYPVETSICSDKRAFSTTDGVVLPNGDILAVTSFRAVKSYKQDIGNGLMTRRSKDNGRTWEPEQVIYEGTNWEPYLLLLPDGRVQCYFTDCSAIDRDSGTSVMTSLDNGYTWSEKVHCCRQYKYDTSKGKPIHTDQMPCFKVLADGKTLLGFMEARLQEDENSKSYYKMSVVRNHSFDWAEVPVKSVGPKDRDTNISDGCAGYVAVFPSGEVVLSCNITRKFSLKLGNASGTEFYGGWDSWYQPFEGSGYWASTEIVDSHLLSGSMHCDTGIETGLFYLNHAIKAEKYNDSQKWNKAHFLYLGSQNGDITLKAAKDKKNLYVRIEGLDVKTELSADIEIGGSKLEVGLTPDAPVFESSIPLKSLGKKAKDCEVSMKFNDKSVTSKILIR